MFPLDLAHAGNWVEPIVHVGLGVAFGAVLERAGFGSARKLTNQFYLNDMSVLKVMFTGIITAAVLISLSVTIGFVDFDKLWVNPTYLGSGILGGMLFGIGFVVGGYCPGTALVAAANLKIDGLLFAVGVLVGIWGFGFTIADLDAFWQESGNFGRFTLPDWLGLPLPWVVVLVVMLALSFFAAGEWIERRVTPATHTAPQVPPRRAKRVRWVGVSVMTLLALVPALAFSRTGGHAGSAGVAETARGKSDEARAVSAREVADLLRERRMELRLWDLRGEAEFNHFHLQDAQRIESKAFAQLEHEPQDVVKILISADGEAAHQAFRELHRHHVENLYWLKEGVAGWLALFDVRQDSFSQEPALGDRHVESRPPANLLEPATYQARVRAPGGGGKKKSGGCGG